MSLCRLARHALSSRGLLGAAARPFGSLSCRRRPGMSMLCRTSQRPASGQFHGHKVMMAAPPPATSIGVSAVEARHEERLLEVVWEDGHRSLYPYTWLRDNCQCPDCTLQSAQARSLLFSQLDIHTGLHTAQVTDNNQVSIVWQDQHLSKFLPPWLRRRCFSFASREAIKEELCLNERIHWDSELCIPTANFKEVLNDDQAALDWLLALRRVGVVHLQGAPTEEGQVLRLAKRIGYLRMTFYGPTWRVEDKSMAVNVAYTSGDLSFHTDYPALHFPPGVQLLHCIEQAQQGGDSLVVDGFHAAEVLQREDPEAFQTLSSVKVDFSDVGEDFCDFMVHSKNRIIDVDSEGQLSRINFNNATRDSVLDLPVHLVQEFYRALKAYVNILNRPANVVTYRMQPGEIVTFDNWRLLHGRKSYSSSGGKVRLLEGAYLDWDEVLSRLRILRKAVGGEDNH